MVRQIIKYFPLIIGVFFFSSCSDEKEEKSIETIIEDVIQRYDNIDYSRFYNLELLVRERGYFRDAISVTTVSYDSTNFFQKIKIPTPSYVNDSANYLQRLKPPTAPWWGCTIINYGGILSVENNKSTDEANISNDSIKSLIKDFLKLDLDYLKVDRDYNVFLSPPPYSFERAFMLKVKDSVHTNINKHLRIEGEGTFTHVKGNWFLSDFYIDNDSIKIE